MTRTLTGAMLVLARNRFAHVAALSLLFRGSRAARGRGICFCFNATEKQIHGTKGVRWRIVPRFARNDTFYYSLNLQLGTLKEGFDWPGGGRNDGRFPGFHEV